MALLIEVEAVAVCHMVNFIEDSYCICHWLHQQKMIERNVPDIA